MDKDLLSLAEKVAYTAGFVTSFWKGIDSLFAYLHKRQRGFISDVVKEDLKSELDPIRDAIAEIKSDREKDNRYQNGLIQQILTELKK